MRKAAAASAVIFALVSMLGCSADKAALGTVQGLVVISPACPVEISPVVPPTGSPDPGPVDGTCTGSVSGATVRAFIADSDQVAASVSTESDGRFRCELPEGTYRFEAIPASPSVGHGVPLNVEVKAGVTVEVTLRIDTGVQ